MATKHDEVEDLYVEHISHEILDYTEVFYWKALQHGYSKLMIDKSMHINFQQTFSYDIEEEFLFHVIESKRLN